MPPENKRTTVVVHALLQTARGYLTDEHFLAVDELLAASVEHVKDLEAERDRYRQALEQIRERALRQDDAVLYRIASTTLDEGQKP